MRKKTWIYIAIAVVALTSILAISVFAAPGIKSGGFKSGFKAWKAERIGRILGITDEQREQIAGVLEKHRGEFRPLVESMMESQRELRDTVMADNYDENAIRKASEEVGRQRTEIALLAGKAYQEISRILTPEQKAFIDDFKQMHREHISDLLGLLDKMPGE